MVHTKKVNTGIVKFIIKCVQGIDRETNKEEDSEKYPCRVKIHKDL